jgi:hypothetical protein
MDSTTKRSVIEEQSTKHFAAMLSGTNNAQAAKATRNPPRNAPCPCQSGMKYKKCCGKPAPKKELKYKSISDSYTPEQQEARKVFIKQWGWDPSPSQLALAMTQGSQATKDMVVNRLREVAVKNDKSHDAYIAAVQKHGFLLSRLNEKLYNKVERDAFLATVRENLPDEREQIEDGDGPPRADG